MKAVSIKIKYAIISFLLVLLLVTLFTSSSPVYKISYSPASIVNSDTVKLDYYLELKGNVRRLKSINEKEEIKPIDSAVITAYSKEILFTQVYTNKKGRCTFKLPLDKTFKITVSKGGFVTKFFEVNTSLPLDKKNTFSFSFDIDLFEDVNGLDIAILKKPIAKVAYNLIIEQFAYDINYTSRINADLKKMYMSYYFLQKAQLNPIDSTLHPVQQKK